MQLERKALYNSLRMSWLMDPSIPVEMWQVEDYRALPLQTLFDRLKKNHIILDKTVFLEASEPFDTPEDFVDYLIEDRHLTPEEEDQIYLLVFELWRRLLPEKQALSIFCDELDHVIYQYDRGELQNEHAVENILGNLQLILDENADEGADPHELFSSMAACCANDIESFLYDFISEQISLKNESYASELLDDFLPYVEENKWFEFLRIRLQGISDEEGAAMHLRQLLKEMQAEPDLEFNLEVLAFASKEGNPRLFAELLKMTIPLIKYEADFQELLLICIDYFHLQDNDLIEQGLQKILQKRASRSPDAPFSFKSEDAQEILNILKEQ